MKFLDIGEVCEKTGLRASALRYYEEIGLVTSASRHGLRRQYAPGVVLQLTLIAMGKSAGFTLDEIAGMFGSQDRPILPRAALRQKVSDLDRQIAELQGLRDVMRHVADCPAPSHLECPSFRRLVSVAARHAKSTRQRSRKKAKTK